MDFFTWLIIGIILIILGVGGLALEYLKLQFFNIIFIILALVILITGFLCVYRVWCSKKNRWMAVLMALFSIVGMTYFRMTFLIANIYQVDSDTFVLKGIGEVIGNDVDVFTLVLCVILFGGLIFCMGSLANTYELRYKIFSLVIMAVIVIVPWQLATATYQQTGLEAVDISTLEKGEITEDSRMYYAFKQKETSSSLVVLTSNDIAYPSFMTLSEGDCIYYTGKTAWFFNTRYLEVIDENNQMGFVIEEHIKELYVLQYVTLVETPIYAVEESIVTALNTGEELTVYSVTSDIIGYIDAGVELDVITSYHEHYRVWLDNGELGYIPEENVIENIVYP